jgi:hypothetical protein
MGERDWRLRQGRTYPNALIIKECGGDRCCRGSDSLEPFHIPTSIWLHFHGRHDHVTQSLHRQPSPISCLQPNLSRAAPVSGHNHIKHCSKLPNVIGRYLYGRECGRASGARRSYVKGVETLSRRRSPMAMHLETDVESDVSGYPRYARPAHEKDWVTEEALDVCSPHTVSLDR